MPTLTGQTPCVRERGHEDTHRSNTVCARERACRHSQVKHRVCERVGMRTLTGQTPCVRESGHEDTHRSNTVCAREWACRHSQVKHHVVKIGVCQRLVEVNWRGQHKHTWRKRPTHPTQSPPVCTVCVCVVLATHVTKWALVYQTWRAVVRWSLCEEPHLPTICTCV